MKSNPRRLIDEFFEMEKELDRLFDVFMEPHQSVTTENTHWRPPVDIYETVDSFIVKVEIAGIKPDEDVKLHLDRNILTIVGYRRDRTQLKKEHYHQAELSYGPFERLITLPNVLDEEVEPVANYENGFLEIHISKAKRNPPKEIVVKVNPKSEPEPVTNNPQKELGHDESTEK